MRSKSAAEGGGAEATSPGAEKAAGAETRKLPRPVRVLASSTSSPIPAGMVGSEPEWSEPRPAGRRKHRVLRLKGGGSSPEADREKVTPTFTPTDETVVENPPDRELVGRGYRTTYDSWASFIDPWMLRLGPETLATGADDLNAGVAPYVEMGWVPGAGANATELIDMIQEAQRRYPARGSRISFRYALGSRPGCRRWGIVKKVGAGRNTGEIRVTIEELDLEKSTIPRGEGREGYRTGETLLPHPNLQWVPKFFKANYMEDVFFEPQWVFPSGTGTPSR